MGVEGKCLVGLDQNEEEVSECRGGVLRESDVQ